MMKICGPLELMNATRMRQGEQGLARADDRAAGRVGKPWMPGECGQCGVGLY